MNNNLIETLNKVVAWSAPEIRTTSRGQRQLRTAFATSSFWGVRNANKIAVKELGIDTSIDSNNNWILKWWTDVDVDFQTAVAATPAPKPSVVQFVAPVTNGMSWSDEQQAIFNWFKTGTGSLVVRARAGTGKTTTIKTAFTFAPEERMLYAVFNKKNQKEAVLAITDPRVEIKTLHALGYMFIQQVWPQVKATDDVENDRVDSVVGEQTAREVKTQVKKLVGFAKNMLVNPTLEDMTDIAEARDIECPGYEIEINGGWTVAKLAASAMRVMEISRERDPEGRISFNDMVWLPVAMGWVRAWFDMVVVDEAQDMNLPQLLMAKGACKSGGRVCVVGDDRQAIYGFRGAAQNGMDMMKQSLNAAELGLTTTYRCPKSVVALASALVPDYKAAATAPDGLVETIIETAVQITVKIGDAILSRSNSPLMPLCLTLLRKGIPARIEGRDIGKMLAAIVDKLNARTVPQFMTKIEAWGEKQINRFANTKRFEEKAQEINDNVATLQAVAEGASSVTEIKNRLATLFQDSESATKPAVVLSSTHKAKGLEWSKVYLLAGTFNRRRSANAAPISAEAAKARELEEANIYYVALTRSKNHLVLVQEVK